jgi:hypothetical protein
MVIMLLRKQQFTRGCHVFLREDQVSLTKRDQDGQQRAELKKTLQKFLKVWMKIVVCQEHSRASEHQQTVRKILTEDLDMMKVCAERSQRSSRKNKRTRGFLASKQITVLEHPPYSPDLAPSDFFLFPKLKEILKRRHFDDIDDIRSNKYDSRSEGHFTKPVPKLF